MHIGMYIVRIRYILVHTSSYPSLLISKRFINPLQSTGEPWYGPGSIEDGFQGEVLPAMRGYARVEENKTAGCMADGLHCNIWARAQDPAKLSHKVIVGHL